MIVGLEREGKRNATYGSISPTWRDSSEAAEQVPLSTPLKSKSFIVR